MELRRIHHRTTTSTSDEAFRALADGTARHGDAHVADEQTQGRGRLGRRWHSPRGAGLWASLVWCPPNAPALPAPAVTMACALGVRAALAELLAGARGTGGGGAAAESAQLELKWPNDLFAGGAKLAGILVETRGLDPRRPCWVVGLGVNLRASALPAELAAERAVVGLAELGVPLDSAEIAGPLLSRLAERLADAPGDLDGLAAEYLAAWGLAGRRVAVETATERLEGVLRGLDLAGGLVLETVAGLRHAPLELVRAAGLAADEPCPSWGAERRAGSDAGDGAGGEASSAVDRPRPAT